MRPGVHSAEPTGGEVWLWLWPQTQGKQDGRGGLEVDSSVPQPHCGSHAPLLCTFLPRASSEGHCTRQEGLEPARHVSLIPGEPAQKGPQVRTKGQGWEHKLRSTKGAEQASRKWAWECRKQEGGESDPTASLRGAWKRKDTARPVRGSPRQPGQYAATCYTWLLKVSKTEKSI